MKIIVRLTICSFLLTVFVPSSTALAKGSPDKITITGPGLAAPIEITDPGILDQFNPWDGQFLDKNRTIVIDAPQDQASYEVLYYSRDPGGEFRLFYAFYYSPEPSRMRGQIYLPEEQDNRYVMNNETIARRSGWLYASPEWDSFMQRLLRDRQAASLTSVSAVARNLLTHITGTSALVILLTVIMALWLLRRRRQMPMELPGYRKMDPATASHLSGRSELDVGLPTRQSRVLGGC